MRVEGHVCEAVRVRACIGDSTGRPLARARADQPNSVEPAPAYDVPDHPSTKGEPDRSRLPPPRNVPKLVEPALSNVARGPSIHPKIPFTLPDCDRLRQSSLRKWSLRDPIRRLFLLRPGTQDGR